MDKPKTLIASVVRKPPDILKHFLGSLTRTVEQSEPVGIAFYDDNVNPQSSAMLAEWCRSTEIAHPRTVIHPITTGIDGLPPGVAVDHGWDSNSPWRVAALKNHLIDTHLFQELGHVFLIDADILVHPRCLTHLKAQEKDIVAQIYWTSWQDGTVPMPQVWECDHYTMSQEFIDRVRIPAVHQVGMLGACTLIHRRVLDAGIRFQKVPNLSFWGEDRHFCIRAAVHGFTMWGSSVHPAMHLYRASDVQQVDAFWASLQA